MVPQWKRWLGAAAVLLLVGAGCQATVRPDASIESEDDGKVKLDADASSSLDVEADAAIDAALKESDADADAALEEDSDADILNNDSAELNAYGQSYVESETR